MENGRYLAIISLMFLVIVSAVLSNNVIWQVNAQTSSKLTRAIGYSGLTLSSECTYTLNPILEGVCQTDVPGGYCYHVSCGMVNPAADGTPYSLKIIHMANNSSTR